MRYIIFFFTLISFSASAQSAIVGTWNINWPSMRSAMTATESQKYTNMSALVKTRVQQSFETRTYRFDANGEFTASWTSDGQNKSVTGMWSEANSNLTIVTQNQTKTYSFSIATPDSNQQLTLTEESSASSGLISTLIMNKAN